jgi:uncharacterized protein YgbK (DUF1537 family)
MNGMEDQRHDGLQRAHYVWVGDDFTGATDTLATLSMAGLNSLLFLGIPDAARLQQLGHLDAIGIAGAARSMTPDAMTEALVPIGHFFAKSGAKVLHYKCCSTFDSAPTVGSIGKAVEVLRPFVGSQFVPIVGGQPNLGRYCSFANLFAKVGHAPSVYRIDRHPVMQHHPVTPMHEADLRVHLAAQGLDNISALAHTVYETIPVADDGKRLLDWVNDCLAQHATAGILDVLNDQHLARIGQLVWRMAEQDTVLVVGASSVAQACITAWPDRDAKATKNDQKQHAVNAAHVTPLAPASTPVFMFAGSMSPVSSAQIAACTQYQKIVFDIKQFMHESAYFDAMRERVIAHLSQGEHVLVFSDRQLQAQNTQDLAMTSARFVAVVLNTMASRGQAIRRVGIAGGDTSSHVTEALGLWALGFAQWLSPGVAMSIAHSDIPHIHGMEIMLKGGQMGHVTLFDDLVTGTSLA